MNATVNCVSLSVINIINHHDINDIEFLLSVYRHRLLEVSAVDVRSVRIPRYGHSCKVFN